MIRPWRTSVYRIPLAETLPCTVKVQGKTCGRLAFFAFTTTNGTDYRYAEACDTCAPGVSERTGCPLPESINTGGNHDP